MPDHAGYATAVTIRDKVFDDCAFERVAFRSDPPFLFQNDLGDTCADRQRKSLFRCAAREVRSLQSCGRDLADQRMGNDWSAIKSVPVTFGSEDFGVASRLTDHAHGDLDRDRDLTLGQESRL